MMGLITAIFGGRPGMISGAAGAVAVIFAPLVIEQTQLHGLAIATNFFWQLLYGLNTGVIWGVSIRQVCSLNSSSCYVGLCEWTAIVIFKAQFSQFKIGGTEGGWMPMPELLIMGILVS